MEYTTLPVEETQYTNQNSKKKIWIIIVLLFVIVLGGIFILLTFMLNKPTVSMPIASHTYKDKGGYFTLQIPDNWQTSEDVAQGTTGIGTSHQSTQNIEETQMVLGDNTGIDIQVYEGTPVCPFTQPFSTTLSGLPSSYDNTYDTWTIPTNKALLTVTISYPGSGVQHNMLQSLPTPIPALKVAQDKQIVMTVLRTLIFINLFTFKC
jgi:hypothetical protein